MKLTLRDLFWLIFVAAVITLWWLDHRKLTDQLAFYQTPKPAVSEIQITTVVVTVNNGDLVEVAIGSDDGVKEGQTMTVSRGNQYLGTIVIRMVSPDLAIGKIDNATYRAKIRKGDTVTANIGVMVVRH